MLGRFCSWFSTNRIMKTRRAGILLVASLSEVVEEKSEEGRRVRVEEGSSRSRRLEGRGKVGKTQLIIYITRLNVGT